MIINNINKNTFLLSNSKIVFYNSQTNTSFGELHANNYNYKIGWDSDLVEVQIFEIKSNIFSIGVDQNFAIIDIYENKILLNLVLFYNFHEVRIHGNKIYICTELEILILDKFNYTILNKLALPDFYEEIIFENNFKIIKCIDGSLIKSNI